VYFGIPIDAKLYSLFKLIDHIKEYNVNWIRLRYYNGDIIISFRYDHIIGASLRFTLPLKILDHVEEVLNTHSDVITKLAEEAKATAMRYVLAHLAIASYAKLET